MALSDVTELLDFDSLLSDEELMIQKATRDFVAKEVRSRIAAWFEEGISPKELATELGALGLLGMHLEGYGCAGTNAVSYGLACLELEAGDSGFRSFVSVQELNRYRKEVTALVTARVVPPVTPDPQAV